MLWGRWSEGGWCFACVILQSCPIFTQHMISWTFVFICVLCVCSCIWQDALSFFFLSFCRLRIKYVLIKLKAKFSDLFLLLFSKLHHHWGETVALRKSQWQNVFVPFPWIRGVILKLKKDVLRVCDFIFSIDFIFYFLAVQTLSQLTAKIYGFMQTIIKSCM